MKPLGIEELASLIDGAIPTLINKKEPIGLYEPIRYIMELKGKRIRPVVMLAAYQAVSEKHPSEVKQQAAAIEVFHNFTLVHDDIMDQAPLRRGQETVHQKWTENHGILSGDAMMIICYQLLSASTPPDILPEILKEFNQTALEVCEGQQEDMDFESSSDVTVESYLIMIRKKTACLLAEGFRMGARLARSDDATARLFYDFGIALGLAFQIQDDYLDAFGDPEKFGKKVGGDIAANKKTLLYLRALELGTENQRKELKEWFSKDSQSHKISRVVELFREIGVDKSVQDEIENYHKVALDKLNELNLANKDVLFDVVKLLSIRSS